MKEELPIPFGSDAFNKMDFNTNDYITRLGCCGIQEFKSLNASISYIGVEGVAYKIADLYARTAINGCYLLFSQVNYHDKSNQYGEKFKAFVLEQGLGTIVQTEPRVNPNSSNSLTAYIWGVDRDAIKKWYLGKGVSPQLDAMRLSHPEWYAMRIAPLESPAAVAGRPAPGPMMPSIGEAEYRRTLGSNQHE